MPRPKNDYRIGTIGSHLYNSLTEEDARWFRDNTVKRIDHKWTMTGVDTADNWLELYTEGTKKPKKSRGLPACVRFTPTHHWHLLELDRWVAEEVDRLDQWDKRHAKDIAELKRLQKKLYGTESET